MTTQVDITDNVPVNLTLVAGVDFSHTFSLRNYDKTPRDISRNTVAGAMAKHKVAIVAYLSTSTDRVWNVVQFDAVVSSGVNGEFSIFLPAERTSRILEGKYMYDVTMKNPDGTIEKLVDGLIFVDNSISSFHK
jgi:hypothetical protein